MRVRSPRARGRGWDLAVLAWVAPLAACFGGPQPLPPGGEAVLTADRDPGVPGSAANPPNAPPVGAVGAAGAPAMQPASTPMEGMQAPEQPAAPAAGSGARPPTAAPTAPTGAAGSGVSAPDAPGMPAAGSGGAPAVGEDTCDGPTGALRPAATAPENFLFVLDRSADMAGDFQGTPRWQLAAQAIAHVVGPRADAVTLGALLYPSTAGSECTGPGWLCALQQPTMCTVSAMSASDQVAFQPGSAALSTLLGDGGLLSAVMAGPDVPLAETLLRADEALAQQALPGRTSVVILASGMPSCEWNEARASETLARWHSDRGVQTHVIALPESAAATPGALDALALAGGSVRVHAPGTAGALEATLQSIVFDSLSSCTLELDPPAPDPARVRVLVTEAGRERVLPRTDGDGAALWTISADGRTVTLLGSACDAARGGAYEAVRVVPDCTPR